VLCNLSQNTGADEILQNCDAWFVNNKCVERNLEQNGRGQYFEVVFCDRPEVTNKSHVEHSA
jgi:hypothetical protein